ncbi:MAG: hypothetical protein ACHQ01_00565 [Candidatus Limnocylindrales bacterium]
MSVSAIGADGLPGVPGDYHGRATRRLDNGRCWVDVLATGGPRIVGFGLSGRDNFLVETPQISWDAGYGTYDLLGGHRLWFAPETSLCSVPDATGLTLTAIPDAAAPAVRLVGPVEGPTGLRRTMEIRLDADSAAVTVHHVIANEGSGEIELAPWGITQLRLGGVAVVPMAPEAKEHALQPNQVVALWPYAFWSDDRLHIGDRTLTVAGRPAKAFKVGCLDTSGVAAYLRDGLLFVLRFDPAVGAARADFGCNVEVYVDESAIELESLGPLECLGPGEATAHDESWELREVEPGIDAAGVLDLLQARNRR